MRLFRRSVGHALVVGGLHCAEKPAASQVTYSLVPFVGLSVLSELLVVNNLDVVDDCIVQGLRRSNAVGVALAFGKGRIQLGPESHNADAGFVKQTELLLGTIRQVHLPKLSDRITPALWRLCEEADGVVPIDWLK